MYNTCDEYIRFLCKEKGIFLKDACAMAGLDYRTIISHYKKCYLKLKTAVALMNSLDGDISILADLPLAKDYYKPKNKSHIYNNQL